MKKWPIKRLVLTGFLTAVLILIILTGIAWHSMMKSLAISAEKDQSHAVLMAIQTTSNALSLANTAHHGYILAQDQGSQQQRETALQELQASINALDRLTQARPEQQAYLKPAQQFYRQYSTLLARTKDAGSPSVPDNDSALSGQATDPAGIRLQHILHQMASQQQRLLLQHQAAEQSNMLRAQVSGSLLLIVMTAFLYGLYRLISRNIRRDETSLALEKSEALLRQILELLPVGVFVADQNGTLTLINPAAHRIWGTSGEQMPKTANYYQAWRVDNGQKVKPGDYTILRALHHGEVAIDQDFEVLRTDGVHKILRCSSMPLRDSQQQIIGAIAVNLDVTDLKLTENALQAAHDALETRVGMRTRELVIANAQLQSQIEERKSAEEALRRTQNILTIAQRVAHVGSWEINLLTKEAQWSDEFFRICGLEPKSVTPSIAAGYKLIHPDDHRLIKDIVSQAVKDHKEYKATLRVLRPDGTIRHVLLQGEPIFNEQALATTMIGSMLDITEQKQNEEMLRQLAVHQQTIKEEERKRIAREIHDEMGQNLMALRIDASMLHARTAATHSRLHSKVEMVLNNIDNTIKSVRSIINNLRPAVLDLGLYASFQWQIKEFQRRSGIQCILFAKADELDHGLSEQQTTTLFRILQESLTNVARHANARCVHIALNRKGGHLHMRIADDGIGIYPDERRKEKSFGLLGMRERITAIGGALTIESTIGHGTILILSIPLEPEPEAEVRRLA